MKRLAARVVVLAAALAFIPASPADAAKARKDPKSLAGRTLVAKPHRGAHLFPPGPVMYGDEYLGDDPDPFIRSQILRDVGARFGGDN